MIHPILHQVFGLRLLKAGFESNAVDFKRGELAALGSDDLFYYMKVGLRSVLDAYMIEVSLLSGYLEGDVSL